MLKHIVTQSLSQTQSDAICDNCPIVTNLNPVFNHEDGQINYCCSACSEKLTKGFLFGIVPQEQKACLYED